MAAKTSFKNDIEFCPECGTILPLPGESDVVMCFNCKFKTDIREFDGVIIKSCVVFNTRQAKMAALSSDDLSGPTVDRKCSKCGHEGMTFATRQTRSADEGQTVFYTCQKCGTQETEYS